MVFSIESLCQKFDDFEENWEDYDDNVKSELNNLVEIYNISDEDYDNLKEVLLKMTIKRQQNVSLIFL